MITIELFIPYLRSKGYILPLFIVPGDLTSKHFNFIFQETTKEVL